MKVGLLQEGDISGRDPADPTTYRDRYQEMIEEVALADRVGFSCWGTSEQHFSPPRFTVSAPEVLYAAVAARTTDIRIRTMATVLLAWNHPVLVAERVATLDIVSNGRAELCTARSNNRHTLEAFGVAPEDTKEQWREGMQALVDAFTKDPFEFHGTHWDVPPRTIVPKPVQSPHPPLSVAASSVPSHEEAGQKGLGVICFENYFGMGYLQGCIDAYRKGLANVEPIGPTVNDYFGLYVATAYCAETREEALSDARDMALGYFQFIIDLYTPMAKAAGYEYMGRVQELQDHRDDLEYLVEHSPSVLIGSPDDIAGRLRELEAIGVDEVVMRVDGFGHERNMRALELIGTQVIPEVS